MQWSQKNAEEAAALLPENNMQDGQYWATVISQKEMPGGRTKEDGTVTKTFWKLSMSVETPSGKTSGECSLFDTPKMFFKRQHFWESVGKPELVNAPPSEYVGKRVLANFKVEKYEFMGESRKKYVVMDFVSPGKEEKFPDDEINF